MTDFLHNVALLLLLIFGDKVSDLLVFLVLFMALSFLPILGYGGQRKSQHTITKNRKERLAPNSPCIPL